MSAIHIEVFSGPFTGTGNALMKKGTVIMNIPTSRAMWNSGSALANCSVDLAYFDYAQKTDELKNFLLIC